MIGVKEKVIGPAMERATFGLMRITVEPRLWFIAKRILEELWGEEK